MGGGGAESRGPEDFAGVRVLGRCGAGRCGVGCGPGREGADVGVVGVGGGGEGVSWGWEWIGRRGGKGRVCGEGRGKGEGEGVRKWDDDNSSEVIRRNSCSPFVLYVCMYNKHKYKTHRGGFRCAVE